MSIAKPTLTNIWAAATPANIEDPGGLNDTGWTEESAAPPFSWMNWVLNKIENNVRYMLARGIPDFDPDEIYRKHDIVQAPSGGGHVYRYINDTPASGTTIGDGTYWEIFGHSATDLTTAIYSAITASFPDMFAAAFAAAFAAQINITDVSSDISIDSGYGVTVHIAKALTIGTAKALFLSMSGSYANIIYQIDFADALGWARTGMAFPFARGTGQGGVDVTGASGTAVLLQTVTGGVLGVKVLGTGGLGSTWSVDLLIVSI